MTHRVAVFLKGYPRLSETFIAQELHALEQSGLDLILVSLRHPTDTKRHPVHDEIRAPLIYLPEYLYQEPMRVLRAWRTVRRRKGYRAALHQFLRDLRRDRTVNRVRRFGQALVAAAELPDGVGRYYSHFIHTPGSVARYASIMTDKPWSCSAHAKDIWTSPSWELAEKLDAADWTVTCTRSGAQYLGGLAADPSTVHLVYHGLDLARFRPPKSFGSDLDGSDPDNPVRFLTVGRAVEKKGLDTLLDALARLPENFHWRWTHIAGGPLLDALKAQAARLQIQDRVAFLGAQSQATVIDNYHDADLFVLPSRVAADGDRDGLPNVIVEAASQGLVPVATPISGIPELVEDGVNGLLVPPDDPSALAHAILRLGRDPDLRRRLGGKALARVHAEFDIDAATARQLELFGVPAAPAKDVLLAEA